MAEGSAGVERGLEGCGTTEAKLEIYKQACPYCRALKQKLQHESTEIVSANPDKGGWKSMAVGRAGISSEALRRYLAEHGGVMTVEKAFIPD